MSDDAGCGFIAGLVMVVGAAFFIGCDQKRMANDEGYTRGRKEQFCIDHAGQWDNANGRCLKLADTITVQVPK